MKKTLKFEQVKHCRSQFTSKLRGKTKRGHSKVAGTQQIDKLWTWCKGFICGRVKTRINGLPNPQLYNQAYQYVWRKNNVEKDLFKLLATELQKWGWTIHLVKKNKVLEMVTFRIPCKYHWNWVLPLVLMAFRGHFQERHVHKPLRGLKNRCNAEAENVVFVRGLERPCYLVFDLLAFIAI